MTDIGKDFELYMNWHTAMQYKPKTTVVEGEKQVDIPSESSEFYDEQGQLLPEFDYVKLGGRSISDILTKDCLLKLSLKRRDMKQSWL